MYIIAAHGSNLCIGNNNELPWYIPEDLEFFKQKTLESRDIIVGSNTYRSLPKLSGRNLYVLSRTLPASPDYTVLRDIDVALSLFKDRDVAVAGGAIVYEQFLPYVDKMYITRIKHEFKGDAFFPDYEHLFKKHLVIKESAGFEIAEWIRK